uniref:RING-type domain-containing protein n=1 Tax=Echeneis naucrates TaxID=173247 RepID=A0A665TQI7_ECHNA
GKDPGPVSARPPPNITAPSGLCARLAMAESNALDELQSELTCPVCLELFRDPVILDCGHHFCQRCIIQCWEAKAEELSNCPKCRKSCTRDVVQIQPPIQLTLHLSTSDSLTPYSNILHVIFNLCCISTGQAVCGSREGSTTDRGGFTLPKTDK